MKKQSEQSELAQDLKPDPEVPEKHRATESWGPLGQRGEVKWKGGVRSNGKEGGGQVGGRGEDIWDREGMTNGRVRKGPMGE